MILLHCAGGLKRGYCLGNVFFDHSPSNVTLYLARLPLGQSCVRERVTSPNRQKVLAITLVIFVYEVVSFYILWIPGVFFSS